MAAPGGDAGLAAGGHITGTVIADDGGAPLEDICVSAQASNGDGSGYARTDSDGFYDIDRLAAGSYQVRFEDCTGWVTSPASTSMTPLIRRTGRGDLNGAPGSSPLERDTRSHNATLPLGVGYVAAREGIDHWRADEVDDCC